MYWLINRDYYPMKLLHLLKLKMAFISQKDLLSIEFKSFLLMMTFLIYSFFSFKFSILMGFNFDK